MSSIDSAVFFIVSDIMSPCHHVVVVTYSMVAIVTAIFFPSFVHNRRHRALVDQHNVCVCLAMFDDMPLVYRYHVDNAYYISVQLCGIAPTCVCSCTCSFTVAYADMCVEC